MNELPHCSYSGANGTQMTLIVMIKYDVVFYSAQVYLLLKHHIRVNFMS